MDMGAASFDASRRQREGDKLLQNKRVPHHRQQAQVLEQRGRQVQEYDEQTDGRRNEEVRH